MPYDGVNIKANLDEALSFRPFAPEDNDLETFEMLTRALKERRVLRFQYPNLDADKAQSRLVHPYHLGCIGNHWYLFAFDVKRQAMRTFALLRLKAPEITTERFTIPKALHQQEDEPVPRHERAIPSSRTPSFITKGVRIARLVKAKTQT